MAFRADEQIKEGLERALNYLVKRSIPKKDQERSVEKLYDIIDMYGPVVDHYPHWHPLVSSRPDDDHRTPHMVPNEFSGYMGLDHNIYFRNAFITCPYTDGSDVLRSVEKLASSHVANITAELLDVPFYMPQAAPVLVKCDWSRSMERDGTIPKSIAVPLLLEVEVPCWRWSKYAETWETMRSHVLGEPRGSRSSLFVNQETGQTLKNIWNALAYSGMYGPLKV